MAKKKEWTATTTTVDNLLLQGMLRVFLILNGGAYTTSRKIKCDRNNDKGKNTRMSFNKKLIQIIIQAHYFKPLLFYVYYNV